jgi:putative oxidoreductase
MAGLGLAILRVTIAVAFAAHGANILFGMWAGPGIGAGGLRTTAALYRDLGLPLEFLLAVLSGVVQFIGGLLLGFGMLTRYTVVALITYLAIGIWKEHWKWGFFLNWINTPGRGHGVEYSVVLIAALVCLLLAGPGSLSIDGSRASSRASRAAGRARLRGKV